MMSEQSVVEEFDFESWANTDKIIVSTNLNQTLKTVESPGAIQKVLAFLEHHRSGWHVPAQGVPIAKIRLNFYADDRILGNLGVGKVSFSLHLFGHFWSKPSGEAEYAALLDLVGLEPG